ncbi:hypothetical protein ACK3TF_002784 [Chlorella vulgaris]
MRCGSRTRACKQQRSLQKHPAPPRSRQEPGTMQTPQNGTRCASQPRQTVPATPGRRRNGGHAGGTVRTGRAQRSDGTTHGPQPTSGSPLRPLTLGGAAAVAASLSAAAASASAAAGTQADAAVVAAATAAAYTPGPVEVGWEIWAGFIAGVIPFAIATVEFSKRIDCGGMLPWMGWRYFLLGTADPGNGGVLQQPRGQTSVFYSVPPPLDKQQQQGPEQQQAQQQDQGAMRPAAPAADKGEEPGR